MQLFRDPREFPFAESKVSCAIGMFDGIHLGHQAVLSTTLVEAKRNHGVSIVATFEHHPLTVVDPTAAPPLVYPFKKRLLVLEEMGIDGVWVIPFTRAYRQKDAREFVEDLCRCLGRLVGVSVGRQFLFGRERSGNLNLLNRIGRQKGFTVCGHAHVTLDGHTVSSTRIRKAIQSGDIVSASSMLGRSYALAGTVIQGEGLARQLGFPTANIDARRLALPPNGVYTGWAVVQGVRRPAVLNIGFRPTIRGTSHPLQTEVHLIDYDGDLYERFIEVTLVQKLRDERRFASMNALKDQIKQDIRETLERLNQSPPPAAVSRLVG